MTTKSFPSSLKTERKANKTYRTRDEAQRKLSPVP